MTISTATDSLQHFVTAVRTDLKTWLQFLSFSQPMPAEHPSRDFAAALFISVGIHVLFAHLILVAVPGRTAVEPITPANDSPLIISLSTFFNDSHDVMDREAVHAVPHTDPPVQRFADAGFKSEAEVVAPKVQDVPGPETPEDKSITTYLISSFKLEPDYRTAWDFEILPELKIKMDMKNIDQGIPGSEIPDIGSLLTRSSGLEAFYRGEQDFEGMSGFEFQYRWRKRRMLHLRNYIIKSRASRGGDCRTVYAGSGPLAIPLLIRDAVTGNGCKWYPELKEMK